MDIAKGFDHWYYKVTWNRKGKSSSNVCMILQMKESSLDIIVKKIEFFAGKWDTKIPYICKMAHEGVPIDDFRFIVSIYHHVMHIEFHLDWKQPSQISISFLPGLESKFWAVKCMFLKKRANQLGKGSKYWFMSSLFRVFITWSKISLWSCDCHIFWIQKIGIRRGRIHIIRTPCEESVFDITNDYFIAVSSSENLECKWSIFILPCIFTSQKSDHRR